MRVVLINYRRERLDIPVKALEEYKTETGVNHLARLSRRAFKQAYAHACGEAIRIELDGVVYPARFFFGHIIWHV